jgi:hypothetical protein
MKRALLAVLVAGFLASCKKDGAGVKVDPALSTLVPADTTILVGIRVEDLTKTPLYKKYLADRAIGPIDQFAQETGINVQKDLWEVLYISTGKDNAVLGRGKFSNEAEPRLARETQGAKRMNYRGFTLVGDENNAVLLMGPSIIGIGDTPALKRIIDTRDKTNGPPAVLAARMKEIPSSSEIWAVAKGAPIPVPPNADANVNNLAKTLNSVESGSFYLDLDTGISGKLAGTAATDPDAKELYDSLHSMLGLAKAMTDKKSVQMQRLYDGLRVTQDGKNVNLYIEEQEDSVATLADLLTGMAGGGGRGRPNQNSNPNAPTRLK